MSHIPIPNPGMTWKSLKDNMRIWENPMCNFRWGVTRDKIWGTIVRYVIWILLLEDKIDKQSVIRKLMVKIMIKKNIYIYIISIYWFFKDYYYIIL